MNKKDINIEDRVRVRIDLDGKTKIMFDKIKEKYNLEAYTETIRLIVKLLYDIEFPNEKID